MLDADDLWLPQHLRRLEEAIDAEPGCAVVFADSRHFTEEADDSATIARCKALATASDSPKTGLHVLAKQLFASLLPGLYISPSASAVRIADGVPLLFDREFRTSEDRDFFLRGR